jgi:hypothetical protein
LDAASLCRSSSGSLTNLMVSALPLLLWLLSSPRLTIDPLVLGQIKYISFGHNLRTKNLV